LRRAAIVYLVIALIVIEIPSYTVAADLTAETRWNIDLISAWSMYQVYFDGKISSEFEWSEADPASVVLFRVKGDQRHFDDNVTVTYFVKNDAEWLYLLVHVNTIRKVPEYTDISLFWDVWGKSGWERSVLGGIDRGGRLYYGYDYDRYKTAWQFGPPENMKGGASCNDIGGFSDCWFEFAKMLRSDDEHDWNLSPGDVVGGRPPDLALGMWFGENGGYYQRYVTLYLSDADFPSFFAPSTPLRSFEMPSRSWVYSIAFDFNGSLIAVGLRDPAEVRLYARNGTMLWRSPVFGRSWAAYDVAISSDGMFLAVGGDSSLEFFSSNGTRLWWKRLRYVYSVSISGDGSRVAFRSGDGGIGLVDADGKYIWYTRTWEVGGVSISPDGSYIAATVESDSYPIDKGARLVLYHSNGSLVWSRKLEEFNADSCICNALENYHGGKRGATYSAPAISQGATAIAIVGMDGKLRMFNRNGDLIWIRDTGPNLLSRFGARAVSMPADARYVAAAIRGDGDAKIHLFSPDGSDWGSRPLYHGANQLKALAVSPDGGYVAGSPNVHPAPELSEFHVLAIPNAKMAVDFASRAISLGFELNASIGAAEAEFRLAQEDLTDGSLVESYLHARKAYSIILPLLMTGLQQRFYASKRLFEANDLRLRLIGKTTAGTLWENASVKLDSARQLLSSAETLIKSGTLLSYERAFATLNTAKQDLLQVQSLLETYEANQSTTPSGSLLTPAIGLLSLLSVFGLILALWKRRRAN